MSDKVIKRGKIKFSHDTNNEMHLADVFDAVQYPLYTPNYRESYYNHHELMNCHGARHIRCQYIEKSSQVEWYYEGNYLQSYCSANDNKKRCSMLSDVSPINAKYR